jgi:hypothetical protein
MLFVMIAAPGDMFCQRNVRQVPSARVLIQSVRKVYASCASYSDKASFTNVYAPRSGRFLTIFKRKPLFFRFDNYCQVYSTTEDHNVVWSIGGHTKVYMSSVAGGKAKEYGGIGTVSLLEPYSAFFASVVVSLLEPSTSMGHDFFSDFIPEGVSQSKLGGVKVFVIAGRREIVKPAARELVIIGVGDSLIRRIERNQMSVDPRKPGINRSTVSFDPHINVKISDGAFRFNPPKHG